MEKEQGIKLSEIAALTGTVLEGDGDYVISGVADLATATCHDASFFSPNSLGAPGARYRKEFDCSSAGVIFVEKNCTRPTGRHYLLGDSPSLAFQRLLEKFAESFEGQTGFQGIHATAVIHPEADLEEDVWVGPNTCIDRLAKISSGCRIGAGCVIEAGVVLGPNCEIKARAFIGERCQLGKGVIVQPGAIIGSCGFGYHTNEKGEHVKLQQLGIVVLEDDVEIGANSTIDRARFSETRIGKGCKIDNQVMIAHGVHVGPHSIIVSQSGVAGSSKLGSHVILAAQTGVTGHVEITDQVLIGARAGVSKSITKPGRYSGAPAMPFDEHHRLQVHQRRVGKHAELLKNLRSRIEALESKLDEVTCS